MLRHTLFIVFSFLLLNQAHGIGTSEPPIKKGAAIQIKSYDAMTRSVEVKIVDEPAVGPNYADVQELIRALGFKGEKAEKFKKRPMSMKGVVYNLKSNLKLLNFAELKARLPKSERAKVEAAGRKARAEAKKQKTTIKEKKPNK